VVVPRTGKMTTTSGEPRALLGVATEKTDNGAKVTEVMENTAAAKAGLKVGDVITSVNGTPISNEQALMETIRKYKPEQSVDITYLRNGKEKKVKATLGKTEDSFSWNLDEDFARGFNRDFERNFRFDMEPPVAMTFPRGQTFGPNQEYRLFNYLQDRPKFGMGVTDNPDGDGVKVSNVEAESNAAKAGMLKDDIITELDGHNIKNVDDLQEELADARDKSTLAIKVLRNGKTESLTLRVPKKIKSAEL
jgi:serine protease Do